MNVIMLFNDIENLGLDYNYNNMTIRTVNTHITRTSWKCKNVFVIKHLISVEFYTYW